MSTTTPIIVTPGMCSGRVAREGSIEAGTPRPSMSRLQRRPDAGQAVDRSMTIGLSKTMLAVPGLLEQRGQRLGRVMGHVEARYRKSLELARRESLLFRHPARPEEGAEPLVAGQDGRADVPAHREILDGILNGLGRGVPRGGNPERFLHVLDKGSGPAPQKVREDEKRHQHGAGEEK